MIRTVAGDIPPAGLGRVNYHEHLFQVSPLLPGDELDDEAASTAEAAELAASGFETMVDATPLGLGRRPSALRRASKAAGLHIVATTGAHRSPHYQGQSWILELTVSELAARFRRDVVHGIPAAGAPTGVRAGVLKLGIGYWEIDPFARRVLEAIGQVHRETALPVMVHTEFATATHEILDLLDAEDVPAARVVLAHVDRNPDPGLHASLAARGVFLGYDGAARARSAPDSVLLDCAAAVALAGHADALLLGGDVARATRYRAYGGLPGLRYLGDRFVPRLRERLGPAVLEQILRTNPARWLSADLRNLPDSGNYGAHYPDDRPSPPGAEG